MITLAERRINIGFDGKEYVYTDKDIKDISADSTDNLIVDDEPLKYLYRLTVRHSLLPNFMLYMPGKHILMLNEHINYFK